MTQIYNGLEITDAITGKIMQPKIFNFLVQFRTAS